jgi:hypothetical protein
MRRHQRGEHALQERRRHDREVGDPPPPRHGHERAGRVDEADARHAVPVATGVLLRDLEEGLLALAVAGHVDERVRTQERLGVVGDVRPAEDDERVRLRRL